MIIVDPICWISHVTVVHSPSTLGNQVTVYGIGVFFASRKSGILIEKEIATFHVPSHVVISGRVDGRVGIMNGCTVIVAVSVIFGAFPSPTT